MQFDSFTFLLFFTVVLVSYKLLPGWRSQKLLLLFSSYLFYAAWSPPLIILIWISTLVDFYAARAIAHSRVEAHRKYLLILSMLVNLGILGYFKYAEFLVENFSEMLALMGVIYSPPEFDIILPIGISFYTFQTMSYTIDVYRKKTDPTDSLLDFSLYVTFFPQLVAGPIVRAGKFLPQCATRKQLTLSGVVIGTSLIIWGLFQKTVLADALFSPLVDDFYSIVPGESLTTNWLAVFSFSMQIYYDFAGYSLCAVGAAMALGFKLPDNFNAPYAASGFSDFWHRWHISLSQWMRDYLYFPLGGNRHGRINGLRNLIIVMFLGGLWHGASWNFVLWGMIHGMLLVFEHLLKEWKQIPVPPILSVLATFTLVTLVWIPFRSTDLSVSIYAFRQLFNQDLMYINELSVQQIVAVAVLCLTLAYQYWRREKYLSDLLQNVPYTVQASLLSMAMLSIAMTSTGDSHAFIYFQF
jgi:alginate O-acetyltransferase complex protein AlgI